MSSFPGGARLAGLVAAMAAIAYLLYPVERRVEGVGLVRPLFEEIESIESGSAAVVTRVAVQRLERVVKGATLFTAVAPLDGSVAFRGEGAGSEVSDPISAERAAAPSTTVADSAEAIDARRTAGRAASRDWCRQAREVGAASWEQPLCTAWERRLRAQSALEGVQRTVQDNEEAGRKDMNAVLVYDPGAGQYVPTTDGAPYPSTATGTVVSLWLAPRMQIGLSSIPVAEVMRDGSPLEVLGVLPAAARTSLAGHTLKATILPPEAPLGSSGLAVTEVLLGGASLAPPHVAALFPGLSAREPSMVVRLRLQAVVDPGDVGRVVRFVVGTGSRPRVWGWIAGK